MKKNNFTAFIITYFIGAMLLIGGANFMNKTTQKQKKKTEQIKQHETNQKDTCSFENFYLTNFEKVYDSLLIINGYYNSKYDELNTLDKDYKKLDSLKNKINERPQLIKLNNSVKNAADEIIDKYAKQMNLIIMPVDTNMTAEHIANAYKNATSNRFSGECLYIFVSPETPIYKEQTLTLRDDFLYSLFNSEFDWGDTDKNTQNHIKGKVYELCKIMETELYNSRKNIEKTFADYYPVLNPKNIPNEYKHLIKSDLVLNITNDKDKIKVKYKNNNIHNPYNITIRRQLTIHDTVMPCDFFEDENSTCIFTIDKKQKLKITKTPKDTQTADVYTYNIANLWDTIISNKNFQETKLAFAGYCDYTPKLGNTASIVASEILYEKNAKKTDTIHDYTKTIARRDALQRKIEHKQELNKQRHDSVVAPSINQANKIVRRQFFNYKNQNKR